MNSRYQLRHIFGYMILSLVLFVASGSGQTLSANSSFPATLSEQPLFMNQKLIVSPLAYPECLKDRFSPSFSDFSINPELKYPVHLNLKWSQNRWRSIREIYQFQNHKIFNELINNRKRLNLAVNLTSSLNLVV